MRDIVVITIAVISIDIGFLSVSSIIEGEKPPLFRHKATTIGSGSFSLFAEPERVVVGVVVVVLRPARGVERLVVVVVLRCLDSKF